MQPEWAAPALGPPPADLAKFAIEVERSAAGKSKKVLLPETVRLMVTPQIKIVQAQEMALGLFLEHRGQSVYYAHGGADVGFVCQLIANKEAGYGAAVMTNSDSMAGPVINESLQSIPRA